jgi:hypothetical protein
MPRTPLTHREVSPASVLLCSPGDNMPSRQQAANGQWCDAVLPTVPMQRRARSLGAARTSTAASGSGRGASGRRRSATS